MTHTEKVHVLFGVLTVLTGGAAVWSVYRPASAARRVWPALAFLLGLFMLIPVERGTRTYSEVGWWHTLLSAFPVTAVEFQTYLHAWIAKVGTTHVLQHKLTGVAGVITAGIEWGRARASLRDPRWRWLLPLGLLAVGCGLGLHGGTHQHLPNPVEQLHHKIYGGCFATAAVILALVEGGVVPARWRFAWPVLMFAAGLDMMLFYRLH